MSKIKDTRQMQYSSVAEVMNFVPGSLKYP